MNIGKAQRISVLMPIYMKHATKRNIELLDRALASVAEQDYPSDAEILIVDDGSPVPVADLVSVSRYGASLPVRILRSDLNQGIVHALNLGIHGAKYELIARMDADDCWRSGKIEKQVARMNADDALTIIGTGMTRIFESGSASDIHIRPDGWSPALRFFVDSGSPFPHGSVLARKDIYRLLGGYPHAVSVAHCEDYALWGVWLRFFKPGMVEESLYNYTVSAGSVSLLNSEKQQQATGQINAAFARLRLAEKLPGAMHELARSLQLTLVQAGVVAYRLWLHRPHMRLPSAAIDPLADILVDRIVGPCRDEGQKFFEVNAMLRGFGVAELSQDRSILVSIR